MCTQVRFCVRVATPLALEVTQLHHSNMTEKKKVTGQKIFDIFLIFAQNIDCGYMLEPPHRGCSNEYPQSMRQKRRKIGMPELLTPVILCKRGV